MIKQPPIEAERHARVVPSKTRLSDVADRTARRSPWIAVMPINGLRPDVGTVQETCAVSYGRGTKFLGIQSFAPRSLFLHDVLKVFGPIARTLGVRSDFSGEWGAVQRLDDVNIPFKCSSAGVD